jgi:hypothetical protein
VNAHAVNCVPWSEWITVSGSRRPWTSVVHERGVAAPVDRPAHGPAAEQVQDDAAVDLSLGRSVLGDVGQPHLVRPRRPEPSLDEVLAGGDVEALLGTWEPPQSQAAHQLLHELVVDDQALLDLECGLHPQDPVGATGALMDVLDRVFQQHVSDLAVRDLAELDVVVGGAVEPDVCARSALRVAQVVQPSDNLVLAFGSDLPCS